MTLTQMGELLNSSQVNWYSKVDITMYYDNVHLLRIEFSLIDHRGLGEAKETNITHVFFIDGKLYVQALILLQLLMINHVIPSATLRLANVEPGIHRMLVHKEFYMRHVIFYLDLSAEERQQLFTVVANPRCRLLSLHFRCVTLEETETLRQFNARQKIRLPIQDAVVALLQGQILPVALVRLLSTFVMEKVSFQN